MSHGTQLVLITGSSGLIGYPLAERLARRFRVIGFDRAGPPHPPAGVDCVEVDVTSDESVRQALETVRSKHGDHIDSVVHLAAYYDFSGEQNPEYEEITVRGTERLLRHLQSFRVEQLIFSSTMLLHAPGKPGERITEDSPIHPTWAYPASKVEAECVIHCQRERIPIVILRIAGVYDQTTHSIPLANQMKRIYEQRLVSHLFAGDLSHGQSFVHLDDVLDAIILAIEKRHQLPKAVTLLIGEPETLGYAELQRSIGLHLHGRPWATVRVPKPIAKFGAWLQQQLPVIKETFIKPWMIDRADDHYELDVSRAQTLLGWGPRHSLRHQLPAMIATLKSDPLQWYRENHFARQKEPEKMRVKTHDELMSPQKHHEMMREHHRKYLWAYLTNVILGAWLIAAPATFGVPLDAYGWSEILSGAFLVIFGLLSLKPMRTWAPWGSCFVGIWLLFAPLVFWAPSAASYASDTIVGSLAIALSVLIPSMPGMMPGMMPGAEIPPGWTYNPSSWLQRTPLIALALVGFFISRYLAAYQLRHTGTAWDPFFEFGTVRILDSDVSKAWPISDAGLGALTYMLEALSGFMGDRVRWRTMPWMVLMFFFLVVPLGVTSIVLVILQPLMVGTWCTLCLVAAVAMLIMVPLALDEVIAMTQFMLQARRAKKPLWRIFWMGGSIDNGADKRTPAYDAPLHNRAAAMVWGVNVPWNLALSSVAGVWLMFAPSFLRSTAKAADSDHLVGALVATFAVMAMAEVGRPLRFVNVLFGVWLLVAPFALAGANTLTTINDVVAGLALIALALRRGPVRDKYGRWDRYI